MQRLSLAVWFIAFSIICQPVFASLVTIGANGINSLVTGLNGDQVGIGQVEESRSSDRSFDTSSTWVNNNIDPADVFFVSRNMFGTQIYNANQDVAAEMNVDNGHATYVAGVMISTSTATAGVAPGAKLYSTGFTLGMFDTDADIASVAGQHIATRNGGDVRAINMSFGIENEESTRPDGTNTFSSFIDWSARVHNVLYVVAGDQTGVGAGAYVPADNFNGITVGRSAQDAGGEYNRVSTQNLLIVDPFSDRTFIDLIAPGDNVTMTGPGGSTITASGTSIAAPHVTGAVALLQQFGDQQTGWDIDYQQHEVMKAVLMNSADKVAGRLGMTRTITKTNGNAWDQSDAAFNDLVPLDEEMGAGHINVARAVQQYSPGEFDPDGAPVPLIGWDFDSTSGLNDINKYVFNQELAGGSYIAVTLAWNRRVEFSSDSGTPGAFDSGDEFESYNEFDADDVINDLDLFLVPRGATDEGEAIWASQQDFMPLEHLFVPIDTTGEYEIWVKQFDNDLGGGQQYAIAWWAEGTGVTVTGDFDGDGDVDGRDFLAWQRGESPRGPLDAQDLADWQANYAFGTLEAVTVPEPSSMLLTVFAAVALAQCSRPLGFV